MGRDSSGFLGGLRIQRRRRVEDDFRSGVLISGGLRLGLHRRGRRGP